MSSAPVPTNAVISFSFIRYLNKAKHVPQLMVVYGYIEKNCLNSKTKTKSAAIPHDTSGIFHKMCIDSMTVCIDIDKLYFWNTTAVNFKFCGGPTYVMPAQRLTRTYFHEWK